mmetsp:Transcript_50645/g.101122  ORF Transcript_50645/g.101122 Transcript_50645/m.101122 type:complete len:316 (-) Transcript_50645:549-1496(-)
MNKIFNLRATIKGHSDWITSLSIAPENPCTVISASRDKTLLIWKIDQEKDNLPKPQKRLRGHSQFVSDCKLSSDGQFCISSSWDKTLRLWDLSSGKTLQKFIGHKKDVLSVSLSKDNRHIVSGSRDSTIKFWNSIGHCKETLQENGSSSLVSQVQFIPGKKSTLLSCDWTGEIKIWDISSKKVETKLLGHKGYVSCCTVSPDGSLCASGGKDGVIMLWDLQEGKHLYSLEAGNSINCLCFSPNRYWLCASTSEGIKVWDLESKEMIDEIKIKANQGSLSEKDLTCLTMVWTFDGSNFLAGYSDGCLRQWSINEKF